MWLVLLAETVGANQRKLVLPTKVEGTTTPRKALNPLEGPLVTPPVAINSNFLYRNVVSKHSHCPFHILQCRPRCCPSTCKLSCSAKRCRFLFVEVRFHLRNDHLIVFLANYDRMDKQVFHCSNSTLDLFERGILFVVKARGGHQLVCSIKFWKLHKQDLGTKTDRRVIRMLHTASCELYSL